jgi:hypothetical protein
MKTCRENPDFVEIGKKILDTLHDTEVLKCCSPLHQTTAKSISSIEGHQVIAMVQKFKRYAKVPQRYILPTLRLLFNVMLFKLQVRQAINFNSAECFCQLNCMSMFRSICIGEPEYCDQYSGYATSKKSCFDSRLPSL